ncbi:MAG: hypothetical protein AB1609_09905 [Bacillota bacterium]
MRHKNYFPGYLFLKCSRLLQTCPLSGHLGAAGRELILSCPSATLSTSGVQFEDTPASPKGEDHQESLLGAAWICL